MQSTTDQGIRPVDRSRRRFTRGGLAASVVLSSLASKPVLGSEIPYICSISGQMSGNTSNPRESFDCNTLGKSPGYWKNHNWVAFVKGKLGDDKLEDGKKCAIPAMSKPGTSFNSVFGVDAFRYHNCMVYDSSEMFPSGSVEASMLQVLHSMGGLNDNDIKALGRAAVASILNASSPPYNESYPLTAAEVIRLFQGVYMNGGTVLVNGSVYWDRDDVKDYFESLY